MKLLVFHRQFSCLYWITPLTIQMCYYFSHLKKKSEIKWNKNLPWFFIASSYCAIPLFPELVKVLFFKSVDIVSKSYPPVLSWTFLNESFSLPTYPTKLISCFWIQWSFPSCHLTLSVWSLSHSLSWILSLHLASRISCFQVSFYLTSWHAHSPLLVSLYFPVLPWSTPR